MGIDEVLEVGALSKGNIVANHLEALDHCPVTRSQLMDSVKEQLLTDKVHIPLDGATILAS